MRSLHCFAFGLDVPLGLTEVGQGPGLGTPGVLVADVDPLAGLLDGGPLEGLLDVVEIEAPEPAVEVEPGVVVDVAVRLVGVVSDDDVFELPDGFALLVPGTGSHGPVPFGVLRGTGVVALAGGVAVCGGGVAVCGVGEDVCVDGVAVSAPEVEVCQLLAPAVSKVKANIPSSAKSLVFMESSKLVNG